MHSSGAITPDSSSACVARVRQGEEEIHEKSLRLLPRQVRHGAAPLGIQSLLLTKMRRSSQGLASRRSSRAQGLVRLFVVSQHERNALCRRTSIAIEHPPLLPREISIFKYFEGHTGRYDPQ